MYAWAHQNKSIDIIHPVWSIQKIQKKMEKIERIILARFSVTLSRFFTIIHAAALPLLQRTESRLHSQVEHMCGFWRFFIFLNHHFPDVDVEMWYLEKKKTLSRWQEAEEDVNVLERKSIFIGNACKILWIEQQARRLRYDFRTARKIITLNSDRVRLHFNLEELRWKAHVPFENLWAFYRWNILHHNLNSENIALDTTSNKFIFVAWIITNCAKDSRAGFTSANAFTLHFHTICFTPDKSKASMCISTIENSYASCTFRLLFRRTATSFVPRLVFSNVVLFCVHFHCIRSQSEIESK